MNQHNDAILDVFDAGYHSNSLIHDLLPLDYRPELQDISGDVPESEKNPKENCPKSDKRIETRKQKKRKSRRKYSSDIELNKGHWSTYENQMYHRFLQIHSKHFIVKNLRRLDKIFKLMSTYITTRKAEQCRSHHQKMQIKYHNFYKIIGQLRMEFNKTWSASIVRNDLQENGHLNYDPLITQLEIQNEGYSNQDQIEKQNEQDKDIFGKIEEENNANGLLGQEYEKTFTHLAFE